MRLERFENVGSYLKRVGPFLAAREAEHNLILGITAGLTTNPEMWGPEPPYLAAVTDRDRVLLATIRTPPYNLVLSEIDDEAFLAPILPDLAADSAGANLPGVLGPDPGVEAFARAWSAQTGRPHRRSMGERIFRLK